MPFDGTRVWPPGVKPPQGFYEIDWSHPLAQALEYAFMFDTPGEHVNLVTGESVAWQSSLAATEKVEGAAVDFSAATDQVEFDLVDGCKSSPFTQAMGLYPLTQNSQVAHVLGFRNSANNTFAGIRTQNKSYDYCAFYAQGAGSIYTDNTWDTDVGDTHYHVCAVSKEETKNYWYRDGVLNDSDETTDAGFDDASFVYLRIGGGTNANNTNLYYYAWSRALTAEEAAELAADPYCFFKPIWPDVFDVPAGGSPYTMAAAQGSYTLTGQATGLNALRNIAAGQGSYTLTGQAATLQALRQLAAGQGSYALTGQAAALQALRKLAGGQGSYVLTGQAANLLAGNTLTADQGSYTLSGQAAALQALRKIAANQGSYTLTGYAANLSTAKIMAAAQGSYSLAGQDVTFARHLAMVAAQGAYTLTGQDVGLPLHYSMTAAQGSYTLSGQDVTFLLTDTDLNAEVGLYTLVGQDAFFFYVSAGGTDWIIRARRRRGR